MATQVVSQSIPTLVQGISQQNPVQRNVGQAESQINFQSNIVEGLSKRPPTEYIADILASTAYPNNAAVHWINRDSSNRYTAIFYNGGVKVYDLAGNYKTTTVSSDGATYLTTTNPMENLKFVDIADYTFVANKGVTVAEDTATTTAKVQEFLIYIKSTEYGRRYKVKLTHPDIAYGVEAEFQLPDGSDASSDAIFRDTEKIADILMKGTSSSHWNASAGGIAFKVVRLDTGATLSTTQGLATLPTLTAEFTFTQYGNTIYGVVDDGNAAYTVETSDGHGNSAMYAIKDEINDFANLPYYAKPNMIIKITGDEGDVLSDYYVKFEEDGLWKETVAPGVKVGLNETTMPFALVNNNDGTFTFDKISWVDRVAGDETTNPAPKFVGKTINNLTFFQNRLGILADQNLTFTENGEFFNFYITTGTDVLDTDPVDIAASGTTVNKLYNSIDFNEQLLVFSEEAQYLLESTGEAITPTETMLKKTSAFNHAIKIAPKSAGKFVYFAQDRNDKTAVSEYFADDDTLTNDGIDVTAGVGSLIPTNAHKIITNTNEDTLCVLCHDTLDAVNSVAYTPSSALGVQAGATCTITVTDYANIAVGTTLTFLKNDGTKVTLTSETLGGTAPTGTNGFRPNESNNTTADNIFTAFASIDGFTVANPAANVITVTRDTVGGEHLTVRSSDPVRLAVTNFSSTPVNANTLFVYKYFWDANKKVQAAWSKWDFTNTQILSAESYDSYLYLLVNENKNTKLLRMDLRNPYYTGLPHNIYLDMRTSEITGTYNAATDLTTYNLPYNDTNNQTIAAVDVNTGADVIIDSSSGSGASSTYIQGHHTTVVFGSKFTSSYQFSVPYVRETKTSGSTTSVTTGRFQIRTLSVNYENTAFFQAVVTPKMRDTQTYEFSGIVLDSAEAILGQPSIESGTYRIPIQAKNTDYTCTLTSSSHLPCNFISAELEGYYHRRSRRI